MALFSWNYSYSVNVKKIDDQHKELINIINSLAVAIEKYATKEDIDTIINELAKYALKHFAFEEMYMSKFGYDDYLQHKTNHGEFIKKVGYFKEKLNAKANFLSLEIMSFLVEWLSNHIREEDKRYSSCFNENKLF